MSDESETYQSVGYAHHYDVRRRATPTVEVSRYMNKSRAEECLAALEEDHPGAFMLVSMDPK